MRRQRTFLGFIGWLSLTVPTGLAGQAVLWAHCDALDGPVVSEARRALEEKDVTPVLKWVQPADEPAIRALFARAVAVRKLGPEARALADGSFFETVVRLHRAGEGAPYTGLKPAGLVEPGIAMADAAVEKGSVEGLAQSLTHEIDGRLRERFARVLEARRHAGESVSAGREYVEEYVVFIHYVEGLAQALAGPARHADEHP